MKEQNGEKIVNIRRRFREGGRRGLLQALTLRTVQAVGAARKGGGRRSH